MKNIGVFGMGVVGEACYKFLRTAKQDLYVYPYDKYKKAFPWEEETVKKLDVIFLCLPTATVKKGDGYEQDLGPLHDCLAKASKVNRKARYILKSTVLPGVTDKLAYKYGLNMIHNPEFLSEKTAVKDFEEQKTIILGFSDTYRMKPKGLSQWYVDLFKGRGRYLPAYFITTAKTSEMIKYTANCFYATKITFFNEIYRMCKDLDINYDSVASGAVYSTGWMNEMHTKVPGRHGLGYDGMCFPKDMKALSTMSDFIKFVDDRNSLTRKNELNSKEQNEKTRAIMKKENHNT